MKKPSVAQRHVNNGDNPGRIFSLFLLLRFKFLFCIIQSPFFSSNEQIYVDMIYPTDRYSFFQAKIQKYFTFLKGILLVKYTKIYLFDEINGSLS